MSVKPYDDPANIILADFSNPGEFINEGSAKGISGELKTSDEKSKQGVTALFSALNNPSSPGNGSWIKMEKKFDPWLNLIKNQAIGVWIKGDGNGQLLNFRIESPRHISNGARGDHFVTIDFMGWKYFELVEIESSEFSNYNWPDSGFYVYDSYRHTVQFGSVDKLQIWYNNLPAGKEVKCIIGTIKALPLVPVVTENPSITIGDEKIVFPVSMEPGMYLELRSPSDCKLFGPKGNFIKDVSVEGNVPSLRKGENKISFTCHSIGKYNPRFQITVISEGKPLPK